MMALPNPLGLLEHNIDVPKSLKGITRIANNEVEPEWLGLTDRDRDVIWKCVKDLYRTGAYPAVSICIRRHGEILLNRSIGHAKVMGPMNTVKKWWPHPIRRFVCFRHQRPLRPCSSG